MTINNLPDCMYINIYMYIYIVYIVLTLGQDPCELPASNPFFVTRHATSLHLHLLFVSSFHDEADGRKHGP